MWRAVGQWALRRWTRRTKDCPGRPCYLPVDTVHQGNHDSKPGLYHINAVDVEFTKSRPYRTTDNALVEGKNGAVVRKHIGYGPIGAEHADAFQKFYTTQFNPYLNFHPGSCPIHS